MTDETLEPLDPFSEVVDERRRWTPDWYGWITQLAKKPPPTNGGGGGGDVPDPLYLTKGLGVNATNPAVINDPNNHRAVDINVVTDSMSTNPGFTNEEALQIVLTSIHGQNTTPAKRTYLPLNIGANYYGAGQKFIMTSTLNSYSMGDTATWGNNAVTYAGGPIGGDEGMGWGLVSSMVQQPQLIKATVDVIYPKSSCDTTIDNLPLTGVAASKDAQIVGVVSSAGAAVGDWLVIGQELATANPKMEAVKVLAVDDGGPNRITAVFTNTHPNGTTVKPATLFGISDSFGFGQDRYLINLDATPVTAGQVTSISGGGFTGDASTNWSVGMVGGDAFNIGMISLDADDCTVGGSFDTGSNRLKSWYSITDVGGPHNLSMHTFSVAGDAAYRGRGPGPSGSGTSPSNYTIRPSLKLLRNAAAADGIMVFEYTAATWNLHDHIELVICPYPDVSGFQYHMAAYTNGGTYRGFMGVGNLGTRMFGSAFGCAANMPVSPDSDPVGWNVGMILDSINTGIQIVRPKVNAIEIIPDNQAGSTINWHGAAGDGQICLAPPEGMQFQTTSGPGPTGRLTFSPPGSTLNPDTANPAMTWYGTIQIGATDPTVKPKVELWDSHINDTDFTKGGIRYKLGEGVLSMYTEAGGTHGPDPIAFKIQGDTKLFLGVPDFGQDVATFSHLAVALKPITFADRVPGPGVGMVACYTDSTVNTFGATVAGGGSNNVLAWYNGSNWTVIGA